MKNVVKHAPEPEKDRASAGIIAPQPELLKVGSYLYRFAHHETCGFDHRAGCWWVRQEDFETIMARARMAGVDLGQKARWDLAVLQKWGSKMNVVVEARVKDQLWAWTGLAKPQMETTPHGKVIRMFGHRAIRQLYLIGMVDLRFTIGPKDATGGRVLTQAGRQSLSITGAKVIPPSSLW